MLLTDERAKRTLLGCIPEGLAVNFSFGGSVPILHGGTTG
jgi:hypothetical protein